MASLQEGLVTRSFPPSLRFATTMSTDCSSCKTSELQDLKGIAEPVRARALWASSVESQFEAFEYADQEVGDR
jgi:hypothetical protein